MFAQANVLASQQTVDALTHQSDFYSHLFFSIFYLRNAVFFIIQELVFGLWLVYMYMLREVCVVVVVLEPAGSRLPAGKPELLQGWKLRHQPGGKPHLSVRPEKVNHHQSRLSVSQKV